MGCSLAQEEGWPLKSAHSLTGILYQVIPIGNAVVQSVCEVFSKF